MRRVLQAFLLVAAILPQKTIAQQPMPLSLDQCIEYALRNNASVKNALIDTKIQKAQNDQTTALAYPKISGKAELDNYTDPQKSIVDGKFFGAPGTKQTISFTLPYAGSTSINGSQLLFDGSVMVALQARNTVMELSRQTGLLTEEGVRYNVQKSYYALVIAYKQFQIIKSSLANARSIAHDIAVTKEAGYAEKIDVDRTNVQVNNLATDSLKVANLLTLSEQALKYNMGMAIDQPIVLTDTSFDNHVAKMLPLMSEQIDYNKRTEFQIYQTQQKLNQYNVKRYQMSALPSLAAFAAAGYNYSSTAFGDVMNPSLYLSNSVIGLQLSVPIFGGFQRLNQVKEARLNIQKTKNNIDNLKLGIDFQTAQSKSSLKNSLLQLDNQKRNLELANSVLDLARKKYTAGVGSNLEVTQAQTDLLKSQNNYFNSLLDVINAEADLQKALGLLK